MKSIEMKIAVMPDADALQALSPEWAEGLLVSEIPRALGEIERVRVVLWARMMRGGARAPADQDRLLDAAEAASVLNCTRRWLYDHAPGLPFTRRLGGKLRFSAAGIQKYCSEGEANGAGRRGRL